MSYNYAMRTLLITLLLLIFPLITLAQDCAKAEPACTGACCAAPAELAADRAGACISQLSATLTGSTPCDWPRHRCAPMLYPCAPCLPVRCVAHLPLACTELCPQPVCLPRTCHMPLVTMWVDDPCPADAVLAGTPNLIMAGCNCAEN